MSVCVWVSEREREREGERDYVCHRQAPYEQASLSQTAYRSWISSTTAPAAVKKPWPATYSRNRRAKARRSRRRETSRRSCPSKTRFWPRGSRRAPSYLLCLHTKSSELMECYRGVVVLRWEGFWGFRGETPLNNGKGQSDTNADFPCFFWLTVYVVPSVLNQINSTVSYQK